MFSKSTEYALRAIIYLAQNSDPDHKIGLEELSKAIGSPRSFTAKIMQKLTKDQNLVSSVTGPGGGFYTNQESKTRSVFSVLELMGEETTITQCVLGLDQCSDQNPCPLHSTYKQIKPRLLEMFQGKSIQQLAKELKNEKTVLNRPRKAS
ncbi:MAG TPA: Rrf2 family transcriptional regulator [Saprospiraceae bacterium]|nr:Rrf2 family transcriptional regulator [Saprospiraceae bacterium]HNT21424.1 Rrf2 family transcriptional regulator [Saprospiraceae bacterium]